MSATAQDVTPDMLRALQQRNGGFGPTNPETKPTVETYQPVAPSSGSPQPLSRLEEVYSARAGRPLTQIGYDFLGTPAAVSVAQSGAIQDDYVLGVGDELLFELRGQENSSYQERIARDGSVTLPKLPPIPAAGRTLGTFRQLVEDAVDKAYTSTKIYVSLGDVHQVSVLVTGLVRTPGMRILTSLATPVDAILLSGGITKSGSLRGIRLIRNGTSRVIDLYSLILKGSPARLGMLQDGDRIYVGPLGATVAISGSVRQPGIFELPTGTTSTNVSALLSLSGGTLIANAYDISKTVLARDGTTRLTPISRNAVVHSGEVVFVDPSRTADLDRVSVMGAIYQPTTRALSQTRSTNGLFASVNDLLPQAYGQFAVIVRHDPRSNSISILPFSIVRALDHSDARPLQSDDTVYVFTLAEIRALTRNVTKDLNTPYSPVQNLPTQPQPQQSRAPGAMTPLSPSATNENGAVNAPITNNEPGVRTVVGVNSGGASGNGAAPFDPRLRSASQGNSSEADALSAAQELIRRETGSENAPNATPVETDDEIAERIAIDLKVPRRMLENAVADQLVWVLDQVRLPGVYAAASGTTLPEMIAAAGGSLNQADLSSVEVTSTDIDKLAGVSHTTRNSYAADAAAFQAVPIRPLDVIRVRQVYADRSGGTVTVGGEVRFPGVFDILRDERLSSVLQRAGGMTEVAYPYGAIFTRRSVAIHERDGNERSARELENQLALYAAAPANQATPQEGNLQFLSGLVQEIRSAPTLGRVAVTADPVVLASRPELDLILEPGDSIFVPKRPSNVTVAGEVLNPGSFQFRSDFSYADYVRLAGGTTQIANDGKTFIVLPDGSAEPTSENWLSLGNGGHIPPGSTIVVPRDLRPFDWGQFLKDATQIVSQLAIAGASLAVLQKN